MEYAKSISELETKKMKEFSKYSSKAIFLNLFLLNGAAIIKGLPATYAYILS